MLISRVCYVLAHMSVKCVWTFDKVSKTFTDCFGLGRHYFDLLGGSPKKNKVYLLFNRGLSLLWAV